MSKAIGGYFGLELGYKGKEFYEELFSFNSARNAMLACVRERRYDKVFLPIYTCGVVIDVFKKNKIEIEFYEINKLLRIKNIPTLNKSSVLIYPNYFGLMDKYINVIGAQIKNLIIDNAQAFYSLPLKNVDTVYSPRKFFGVADGGYLSSNISLTNQFEKDVSYKRMSHLLKRLDVGAEEGYEDFQKNDASLNGEPIKLMSNLTKHLLTNIDYDFVKRKRNENFIFLHRKLASLNQLELEFNKDVAPLVYPFLTDKDSLRRNLIKSRIFIPKYWPDVLLRSVEESIEYYLTNNILPLPIDQRYSTKDMERIISFILQ